MYPLSRLGPDHAYYRYLSYLGLRAAYLKNIDTNLDASFKLEDFIDGTPFSV